MFVLAGTLTIITYCTLFALTMNFFAGFCFRQVHIIRDIIPAKTETYQTVFPIFRYSVLEGFIAFQLFSPEMVSLDMPLGRNMGIFRNIPQILETLET